MLCCVWRLLRLHSLSNKWLNGKRKDIVALGTLKLNFVFVLNAACYDLRRQFLIVSAAKYSTVLARTMQDEHNGEHRCLNYESKT